MRLPMQCKILFNIPVLVTAIIVTLLVGLIILGGVKRIATASSVIVPFMAILYVTTSLVIILLNIEKSTRCDFIDY